MTEDVPKTERANTVFYGLVFVFLGVLILAGALRAINPPEGTFLPDTPPVPVDNTGLFQILSLLGFVGLIISTASILGGIILATVGFRKQEKGYDAGLRDSFRVQWASSVKFKLFFIFTLVWAMAWLFNTLSASRIGPLEFPLYFVRKNFLQRAFPTSPAEDLPASSSYQLFGITMDLFIVLLLFYMIYVRIRPGDQPLESVVNFTLGRPLFFSFFWGAAFYHLIGHLPLELYGAGQWGGGFEQDLFGEPISFTTDLQEFYLGGWRAFDKYAHMATSIVITMGLVGVVTRQFREMGVSEDQGTKFILLTAGLFLVAIGVFWEFVELLFFFTLQQVDVISVEYFAKEFTDSMKDLVWDSLGAVLGLGFSLVDRKLVARGKVKG